MKYNLYIIFILFSVLSYGQDTLYVNLQTKKIFVKKTEIQIDSLSIQPYFFKAFINDTILIPSNDYQIDFVLAKMKFIHFENYKNKEITLQYLLYPAYLKKSYQRYDPKIYLADSIQNILLETPIYQPHPLEGLKTKGSITRGFNIGNNQSLVMQSGLDLKIEGNISSKIKIKALLSDDNLPQAYAGISQSYKEFDQIYMQLSSSNWQATGGDLQLDKQDNYFLKISRKTQGLSFQTQNNNSQIEFTGGYVEGKFGINRFNGIEGNQGPYVLKGNQNENYIFIIPESEKVYINGKLLKKGNSKDYIINYETAEIHFNATCPISSNHRITIKFNYSNQHYVKYLNYNKYQYKNEKLNVKFYSFIEADAKNKSLLYNLNKKQINILRSVGDNQQNMWISTAQLTSYNENKILYKKINYSNQTYFEFTTENLPELYEIRFTYVGKNQGNYKIKKIIGNGKIYEYTGKNQGDYIPYIKLTAPKNKKYAGVNFSFYPSEKTKISLQSLLSNTDENLFSNKNDNDNNGGAIHLEISQNLLKKKNLFANFQYDYIHKNFHSLDPYRPIEFQHQWQIDTIFGQQHLLDFNVAYLTKKQTANMGFRYFNLRDTIKAQQSYWHSNLKWKKWQTLSDFQITSIKNMGDLQAYNLHQQISYKIKKHTFSTIAHVEKKEHIFQSVPDSLNYRYRYSEFRLNNQDTTKVSYYIFYRKEQNDSIFQQQFNNMQSMNIVGFFINSKNDNYRLEFFAQYKHIHKLQKHNMRSYLNIKTFWQQFYFNKFLSTQIEIESFNGNILQNEVIFIKTPTGQGTHQWNDYNNNGIQEINEFEIAIYSDQANYIRVILPSKNYISTLNNRYAGQIIFNPEVWKNNFFLKKIYGIIHYETQYENILKQNNFPLQWQANNNLSENTLWQQDWFFNRTLKKYHLHFSYQLLKQKQLLLIGQQKHKINQYQLISKHQINQFLIWKQKFSYSKSFNQSENYAQQNYQINQKEIEEGIELNAKKNNYFYSYFNHKIKKNLFGNEHLKMYQAGLKYYTLKNQNNSINIGLKFILNNLKGNTFSPVSFQMLEGLQKGKNLVFNTLYKRKINSYLIMHINYSFRLSETHNAIHTGGVQLKMLF